jgi:hypothetical protein
MKLPNKVGAVEETESQLTLAKRAFPDYYETIKVPMSLEMVQAKLDDSSYETLREVFNDLGQIFNNAKRCRLVSSLGRSDARAD